MSKQKYPLSKVSIEEFTLYYAAGVRPSNEQCFFRGAHDYFNNSGFKIGDHIKTGEGVRLVVWCNSSTVLFMIGKQMYSQDIVGFSLDGSFGGFEVAGKRSAGMVAFSQILMGLLSAGFATTSWPAFWLITISDVAEGVLEVKKKTDFAAILRFASAFIAARAVLKPLASKLYDKLFDALLKQVMINIGESLDPEGIGKIMVGIVAAVIKKKFSKPGPAIFVVIKVIVKSFIEVLKAIPQSLVLSERQYVSSAASIATILREKGITVSDPEILSIAEELKNPKVLEALTKLNDAAKDVKFK